MRSVTLNSSQVAILQAIAKSKGGLSKAQIEEKTGASVTPENLGPVYSDTLTENAESGKYQDSLYGLGLARPIQEETGPVLWQATSKGQKTASSMKFRPRLDKEQKVPAAKLVSVLAKFRPTRSYGLEEYTNEDLKEIRSHLGADWKDLDLGVLRSQMTNLRKQGAFVDPAERVKKIVQRVMKEFGPEGTVIEGLLTPKQIEQLNKLAAKAEKQAA